MFKKYQLITIYDMKKDEILFLTIIINAFQSFNKIHKLSKDISYLNQ